jgi:hypothetical protein
MHLWDLRRRGAVADRPIVRSPRNAEAQPWCHEGTEVVDIFAPPREDIWPAASRLGYAKKAEGFKVVHLRLCVDGSRGGKDFLHKCSMGRCSHVFRVGAA